MQALASIAMGRNISSLLPIVLYLSRFLPLCGISYEGLITGPDIDKFKTICGGKYAHPIFFFMFMVPILLYLVVDTGFLPFC